MKTKLIAEFSEKWLKAALVDSQGLHNQVKNVFLEPLAPDFADASPVLDKVFAASGRRRALEVTVCLSRNKITVRRIDLPSREPKEIEQMLSLHVIRQVPYPKEEIVFGYQNLGFDGISNSNLLLAIANRQMLKKIFNVFTPSNVLPENLLLSSYGIIHYLRDSLKDKSLLSQPHLILDIDYDSSELILVNKQQIHSTVMVSQGAGQLKSEEEKAGFAAELKQALPAFRNDLAAGRPVTQLFLTGAAESLGRLDAFLETELNLKTQSVKSRDAENFKLSSRGVSFSAVLGFAYQQRKEDISFTLPEIEIKKEMKLKLRQLLVLGVTLAYIFIMLGLTVFSRLNQRQAYRDKLNARISRLKENTGPLMEIAQKLEIARQYTDTKQSVSNYIYELTRILPDNITLTGIAWERQKGLSLRGWAYQIPDIFGFVATLENSSLFKGMQVRSTRRHKQRDKEGEVVDFELGVK